MGGMKKQAGLRVWKQYNERQLDMTQQIKVEAEGYANRVRALPQTEGGVLDLEILADEAADFRQWFSFSISGPAGSPLTLRFVNAGQCSYPGGWEGYRVCVKFPDGNWTRTGTGYEDGVLQCRITLPEGAVELAYFPPFEAFREQALLDKAAEDGAEVREIGRSVQDRPIHCLQYGLNDQTDRVVWLTARQHPGETQGGYWMEGALAVLEKDSPVRQALEEMHVAVCIVPNTNPDGSALGNLRSSATGANLNRCWGTARGSAPEIDAVMDAMLATGVDFSLDVHGDEVLPYVFTVGPDGLESWDEAKQAGRHRFDQALLAESSDFQMEVGYDTNRPGHADISKATPWISDQFGCLSLTLEMPFKDAQNAPDDQDGWSIERSRRLGEASMRAILKYLSA